jgi:predicted permease
MAGWLVVLLKITAMFLVILTGWLARHRNYLTAETTATISRFVVDLTMPAMIVANMLVTVNADTVRVSWFIPLLGMGVLLVGQGVGTFTQPLFGNAAERGTFIFLVAVANWIYLPLPIVQALYGAPGVNTVLLFNVGAQLMLWSVGVWTLRGGKPDLDSLRALFTNPGLIATLAGILLALSLQGVKAHFLPDAQAEAPWLVPQALVQALKMVGDLTIPLSLVVTGAQLGGLDISGHRPTRAFTGVLLARLLVAPAVTVALVLGLARLGLRIPDIPRMVAFIIAAMPVAVSCSIFTERFGGSTPLAARTIFASTLLSIATVPAIFYLIQRMGW